MELQLIHHETGCVCYDDYFAEDYCVCTDDERLVRARISRRLNERLTTDERARLAIDAAVNFGGESSSAELQKLDDIALCRAWIDSCVAVARKHGLM